MEDELESALSRKLGSQLEEKIGEKAALFGGLLTRGAAVKLLCRENGISLESRLTLSQARHSRMPFSFSARVDRIFPIQEYPGSLDISARLHISDRSGKATLVLWNEQTALVKGPVSSGDRIECNGAYSRGGEIGIGHQGGVECISRLPRAAIGSLREGPCSVEGTVREIAYPAGNACRFTLCDGNACCSVLVWRSGGVSQLPAPGDRVALENAFFSRGELHMSEQSRLLVLQPASEKNGILEEITSEGGLISFKISGEGFSTPAERGLAMLGIRQLPPGMLPATAAMLKAGELCGRRVAYQSSGAELLRLAVEGKK